MFRYSQSARPRLPALCVSLGLTAIMLGAISEAQGQTPPISGAPRGGELDQQLRAAPPNVLPAVRPSPLPSNLPRVGQFGASMGQGERVAVRGIRLTGNRAFSTKALEVVLPPLHREGETLADLDAVAQAVAQFYRSKGYVFARAFFPAQQSADGYLTLLVLEGQFDRVTVTSSGSLRASTARDVVLENLCAKPATGCRFGYITEDRLQRSTLLLQDMPGVEVKSTARTGAEFGTASLDIQVQDSKGLGQGRFLVTGGADNFGSSSTGKQRGSLGVLVNQPLGYGDRFSLSGSGSGDNLWSLGADYNFLLTASGARLGFNLSRSSYLLGEQFAALDASGSSYSGSVYATYPVIRSLSSNLTLGAAYVRQDLRDRIGVITSNSRSTIDKSVISASGNWLDGLFGGGAGQYSFGWSHGYLDLKDAASLAVDQAAAGLHTNGAYDKLTFGIERQHAVMPGLSLLTSLNGQYSFKNLTSAERMFIGGPSGVRAYLVGDGGGDSAAIGTLELRYTWPISQLGGMRLTAGGFADGGWVRRIQDPPAGVTGNEALYSGAGLRLSLDRPGLYSLNLLWARQLGGRASSVNPARTEALWLQLGFQL